LWRSGDLREAIMAVPLEWKKIGNFGSLRERDCFLSWMLGQIASGISEEIEPPPDQPRVPGDRWFRHVPTGSLWRLVSIDNSYGVGFWPALEKPRVQRRLAAILAADVVGYSALMERDEEATYAEFERLKRELIEPSLSRHEGRLIKTTGDGVLVEFASPLAAVRCAVEIQDHLASGSSPLRLRVGLNLGDVIVGQDGELYGDGINIAVRLEGIADPGGILISEKVYSEVDGKLDVDFEDRGGQQLKNISKPVRAYAVRAGASSAPTDRLSAAPPLPDKPSIAVLPFENMSGDPEQEYFADGMVEEIITALSRFKWLFVIARNSSFTFKGRAVDIKEVGRRLGVRYVLEGSVRKASGKVRITAQLIDATTGIHLWSDRFEGALENVFELQDQVARSVVGAIDPKLQEAEIARVKGKPPANYDAYDCFLRASALIYQWKTEGHEEALRLFYKAIELDPDYGQAYAFATSCYCWRKVNGLAAEPDNERRETERLAREAIRLGKDDAFSLSWAGFSLAMVVGELNEGAALIERALTLNPNLARSWNLGGWVRLWLNQPEVAIEHFAQAMRLSPLDFALHAAETGTAFAHLRAGRYEDASIWAEKALRDEPRSADAAQAVALSSALTGDLEKAKDAIKRLLEIAPSRRISTAIISRNLPPEHKARLVEILRRAGMPD
jgi:adenylate cyclase